MEEKIKSADELLFTYLTKHATENLDDIDNFVNIRDNYIYLVEDKEHEPYFIIGGKVKLTADGQLDMRDTDSMLFVRNARTYFTKAISVTMLKKVLDYTTLEQYTEDLREAFLAQIENIGGKHLDDHYPIEEFKRLLNWAMEKDLEFRRRNDEDLFHYAARMSETASVEIKRMVTEIYEIDKMIRSLWSRCLYNPDMEKFTRGFINNILMNFLIGLKTGYNS